MRVTIESTGGFTGREVVVARYDTSDLPAGRADTVRRAVRALDAAQARGGTGEIGADLPGYRVTVDDPDAGAAPRVYEVRGDPSEPSPITALLAGPD
ncbi:protealysin inhibitor emfourin [Actinomadura sp. NTSP31]|uniref:protealysin inhibitor emfourin n=1 Tax=Actinomadura sp. NTSP31 TaxID=1735447 RepID=UPI0035BFEADB